MQSLMQLIEILRKEHRRHQAVRQLRQMSPHQLRDVGIEPHRIEAAVDGLMELAPKKKVPAQPSNRGAQDRRNTVEMPDRLACC